MSLILLFILIAVLLGGLGFAVHILWYVALVALIACGVLYLLDRRN